MSFTQQIQFRPGAIHVLSRRMWWVTETILHVCALFTAFFLSTDSTSCFSVYAVIICWVLHIVGNMLSTLRIPNLPLKLSSSCFSRQHRQCWVIVTWAGLDWFAAGGRMAMLHPHLSSLWSPTPGGGRVAMLRPHLSSLWSSHPGRGRVICSAHTWALSNLRLLDVVGWPCSAHIWALSELRFLDSVEWPCSTHTCALRATICRCTPENKCTLGASHSFSWPCPQFWLAQLWSQTKNSHLIRSVQLYSCLWQMCDLGPCSLIMARTSFGKLFLYLYIWKLKESFTHRILVLPQS